MSLPLLSRTMSHMNQGGIKKPSLGKGGGDSPARQILLHVCAYKKKILVPDLVYHQIYVVATYSLTNKCHVVQ